MDSITSPRKNQSSGNNNKIDGFALIKSMFFKNPDAISGAADAAFSKPLPLFSPFANSVISRCATYSLSLSLLVCVQLYILANVRMSLLFTCVQLLDHQLIMFM